MSSESKSESVKTEYWNLAIRKTVMVFCCMAIAYFLVVFSTLMFYVFFSILTQSPQNYPGIIVWQPFWTLVVIGGFLVGLFKAIIDIIKETKTEFA